VRKAPSPCRTYDGMVANHGLHACRAATPFAIKPINAFYLFLGANMLAAFFAPIQDCDETFNYWEPIHYLSHGYGLQTWEYSPDYAIRSWFYIGLHAIVGNARRLLPQSSKLGEFYFIRGTLALACSLCQVWLFRVVSIMWSGRIGLLFLVGTVISPGNFNSAAALLPSSFAMYTSLLGAAAFINWRPGSRKDRGIGWFAVGTVLGWPFAAALCLPYLLEEAVLAVTGDQEDFFNAVTRVSRGGVTALLVAVRAPLTPSCLFTNPQLTLLGR
jgi:alpha-1,2-mannosyltransferase